MAKKPDNHDLPVTRDHRRQWRDCLYVYPVISRRARGLSVGVNLNPDKRCNFACLYCQINRSIRRDLKDVDIDMLRSELKQALQTAASGELLSEQRFTETPAEFRRINDIAFSGDGEPTCLPNFDGAVQVAADVRSEFGLDDMKIVVITNASMFDQPQFQKALPILDANNGEIWAKLDAGTEEYFQTVNRPHPKITLRQVLDNIISIARGRAVVIQTLLFKFAGQTPAQSEIDAYSKALCEIISSGGQIKLVQLHTIARSPSESVASSLSNDELDAIANQVRERLGSQTPLQTYYGSDVPPQAQ